MAVCPENVTVIVAVPACPVVTTPSLPLVLDTSATLLFELFHAAKAVTSAVSWSFRSRRWRWR